MYDNPVATSTNFPEGIKCITSICCYTGLDLLQGKETVEYSIVLENIEYFTYMHNKKIVRSLARKKKKQK